MKTKLLIGILVIIAIVCGSFYYIHSEKIKSEKKQIKNFVLNDQAKVKTLFNAMSKGSSITFRDALSMCEKSIESREDTIVKLRSLTIDDFEPTKDSMIRFFEKESDLIRAYSYETQKLLDLSTATDNEKEAFNDYMESSYYGSNYERNRWRREREKTDDARTDYYKSKDDFENDYWAIVPSEKLFLSQLNKIGIDILPSYEDYRKKLEIKTVEEKKNDSIAFKALMDSIANKASLDSSKVMDSIIHHKHHSK